MLMTFIYFFFVGYRLIFNYAFMCKIKYQFMAWLDMAMERNGRRFPIHQIPAIWKSLHNSVPSSIPLYVKLSLGRINAPNILYGRHATRAIPTYVVHCT